MQCSYRTKESERVRMALSESEKRKESKKECEKERKKEREKQRKGDKSRGKLINETRIHKIESYREKTEERRYFFIFLTRSLGDER